MDIKQVKAELSKYNKVKNIEIRYSWIIDDNYGKSCYWCGGSREYGEALTENDKVFEKQMVLCEDCKVDFYTEKKQLQQQYKELIQVRA